MRHLRALRAERGQSLILLLILLPVLLGFAGLVIDGAHAFGEKRRAQNAADAAALAAAQNIDTPGCGDPDDPNNCVRTGVSQYLALNLTPDELSGLSMPLPRCTPPVGPQPPDPITTNCYAWPYYKNNIPVHGQVEVKLKLTADTFLIQVIGVFDSFHVAARAVAAATPQVGAPGTLTQTFTNGTSTSQTILGQSRTGIFARYKDCSSFFIPGDNVHVTGVETWGGIGNVSGTNNRIDAVKMNYDFWPGQIENCSYSGPPVLPSLPDFWCYSGGTPCGGTGGATDWPVPFPTLDASFRSPDSHCLYTNTNKISTRELTAGQAKVTMSRAAHCLHTGDTVIINLTDNRFDCLAPGCPVTVTSNNSFAYAKTISPFSRTVTQKKAQGGTATLTLSGTTPLFTVGDIISVSGVDSTFNGTYTVTAAAAGSVSYAKDIGTVNLNVTNKALSNAGVATLTTSLAHNLLVGATVTVNIGDPRFDGSYQVTAVTATTFNYTPTRLVRNVTNKEIAGGVATLTTAAAHGMSSGDTVTVALGDKRFDGTFTVTSPTTTTFSYTPPTIATNAWAVTGNVATLTATAPPHHIKAGNVVAVGSFSGMNPPTALVGTWTVSADTSSTFSFPVTTANGSGNSNSTTSLRTVAPTAASGTATMGTAPSKAANGTVTVPGFVAQTASGGTVSFTGNVAPTSATGTITSGVAANATIGAGWTTTHPPGIYAVDGSTGVQLTINSPGTTFTGYTFVAPQILISSGPNTFTGFASAPQQALFLGYDPSGDAVKSQAEIHIDGNIFCGPATGPEDTSRKCWFGGNNSTFHGLMEAWRIEYKCSNCDFDGTGDPIGQGTSTEYSTVTNYSTQTITTPGTPTSTDYGLDE